jgi:hypothetical protein
VLGFPAENFPAPVSPQAIPYYKNLTSRVIELQLFQERHAFCAADILPGVEPEEKSRLVAVGPSGNAADGGNFLVGSSLGLENRRFSARCPGPPHHGRELKRRLVGENQDGLQSFGFFLILGNSFFTQCRIRLSSRSIACFSGRCGLQPRRERSLQM